MPDGTTWNRKRKETSSTKPYVYENIPKMDFNEAVRRAAYGIHPLNSVSGESPVRNDRDVAKLIARYQELSRNPTLKNIRAAARIYNGLEQKNYHDALRSARKGARAKDITRTVQSELNRDLVKRRNQQRMRRMRSGR